MDPPPKRRFQFSLRQLICATLICAALLYTVLARETWRLKCKLPGVVYDPQSVLTLDDSKIITQQTNSGEIYDTNSGNRLLSIPVPNVTAAAISLDGRYAAVGTSTGSVEIWSVVDGTKLCGIVAHKDQIESMSFSGDGRYLITSSSDLIARVWDVQTGRVHAELTGHTGLIHRAYLNSDGSTALTLSDYAWGRSVPNNDRETVWGDNTEKLWDTRTQQVLKSGTRWSEKTNEGTVFHDALTWEERKPYMLVSSGTRDGRLSIIRPSYGQPWCIDDREARSWTFEFYGCVGRMASAFFGHNEEIVVTCPWESRTRETRIWQHLNSSSRHVHWWLTRLLGAGLLFYVVNRMLKKWRSCAIIKNNAVPN